MRKGVLGSIFGVVAGAGLALGQPALQVPPPAPPGEKPAAPKTDAPKVEAPKVEAPQVDAPKSAAPKAESIPAPTQPVPAPVPAVPAVPPPGAVVTPAPVISGAPAAAAPAPAAPGKVVAPPAGAVVEGADSGIALNEGPNAWVEDVYDPQGKPGDRDQYYPTSHLTMSFELLSWWTKNGPLSPALVSTSPPASQGTAFQPGTRTLFGSQPLDFGTSPTFRGTIGYTSPDELFGIEVVGLLSEMKTLGFSAQSDAGGSPLLARPVFDLQRGNETAYIVASPGLASGSVNVNASSRVWGFEANALVYWGGPDMIFGFRYLNLDEDLRIDQSSTLIGGITGFNGNIITAPANVSLFDNLQARSQFYGGTIGLQKESHNGKLFLYVAAKVSLGNTHQSVEGSGTTTLVVPGAAPQTARGGLLVVSDNLGTKSRDAFSIIPELAVNVGVDVTRHMRAYVGYNFLYWTDVARPGDQANRLVNPGFVPSSLDFGVGVAGQRPPALSVQDSHFWAQGLTFGVAFRF